MRPFREMGEREGAVIPLYSMWDTRTPSLWYHYGLSLGTGRSGGIRQIDRTESRQVNHLLHIMTTDFVRRCWEAGVNTIAIGDLTGIREQIDYSPTLNQRLHACPYGKIVKMIEYKADLYGIEVVKVSEAYSSQTCHGCGEARKTNRIHRGLYWCDADGGHTPM